MRSWNTRKFWIATINTRNSMNNGSSRNTRHIGNTGNSRNTGKDYTAFLSNWQKLLQFKCVNVHFKFKITFKVLVFSFNSHKSFLWHIDQLRISKSDYVCQNSYESCFVFELQWPSFNWSIKGLQRTPVNHYSRSTDNGLLSAEAEQDHRFI